MGRVDGRDAVEGGGELFLRQPRARAGNDVLVHARDATGGRPDAATVAAAPDLAAIRTAPIKRSENGHVRAPEELTLAAMTNAIKHRRPCSPVFSPRPPSAPRRPRTADAHKYRCEGAVERLEAKFRQIEEQRGYDKAVKWWDKAWAEYHDRCVV